MRKRKKSLLSKIKKLFHDYQSEKELLRRRQHNKEVMKSIYKGLEERSY